MAAKKSALQNTSAQQHIEEAVVSLINHREHISLAQAGRIFFRAVPLKVTGTLLLSCCVLVWSSFTLGWRQGDRIFGRPVEENATSAMTPTLSAREAVSLYYQHLSSGDRQKPWEMLANEDSGEWSGFWKDIDRVDVLNSVTAQERVCWAEVRADLEYHRKDGGEPYRERRRFQLVRDVPGAPRKLGVSCAVGSW